MKYRVIKGLHIDQHGREYQGVNPANPVGDVLEGPPDLEKLFVNKFELVPDYTPVTLRQAKFRENARLPIDAPPDGPSKQDIARQQKLAKATDDIKELERSIKNNIERAESAEIDTAPKIIADGPIAPAGKEVTAEFPDAVQQDMKVYKNGVKYFVYDGDNLHLLNTVGVPKAKVKDIITAALNPCQS